MAQAVTTKELRKFALIAFIFFGIIAGLQWKFGHHPTAMKIFSGLSAYGLLSSITFPIIIRPLHWLLTKVAHYIGWFNTRLLLGIMFYLVFTPVGFLMKLLGKDLLSLKLQKNGDTYWITKPDKPFSKSDYEKQF